MSERPEIRDEVGHNYVSTGHLPSPQLVKALVSEGYERFKSNTDGINSDVYPALARVPRELFGVCVVGTSKGQLVAKFLSQRLGMDLFVSNAEVRYVKFSLDLLSEPAT
jgi:hypothetical protein